MEAPTMWRQLAILNTNRTTTIYLAVVIGLLPGVANACSLAEGAARAVVSVIDGDTLLLDDQSKLRLIGALRPAPPSPGTPEADWPPAAAAREALERFVTGQSLLLEFDQRAADRYGTQLAQAFVVSADGSFWLQGRMVEEGLARAYSFPDNHGCAAELVGLEAAARALGRGLWANAAYAVRDADKTKELLHYTGSYQLVQGTVAEATQSKGRVYLDFGADWHTDFSVAIEPKGRQLFEKASFDLLSLKGKTIRVRGWIENTNGPQIRVSHPEQIEMTAADGSATVVGTPAGETADDAVETGPTDLPVASR